jgi:hypothetical protein
MSTVIEVLRASLFSGIPIFLVTYLLISRAIVSNRLDDFSDTKELNLAMKNMSKQYKESKKANKRKSSRNRVLDKWLYFGGGFYGLMALVTYAYIEIGEIVEFLGKLLTLKASELVSQIGFNLLIDLFVEAIRNIIDAFVWFSYWGDEVTMKNGWYWLIAAYLGYTLGAQLAQREPFALRFRDIIKGNIRKTKSIK